MKLEHAAEDEFIYDVMRRSLRFYSYEEFSMHIDGLRSLYRQSALRVEHDPYDIEGHPIIRLGHFMLDPYDIICLYVFDDDMINLYAVEENYIYLKDIKLQTLEMCIVALEQWRLHPLRRLNGSIDTNAVTAFDLMNVEFQNHPIIQLIINS